MITSSINDYHVDDLRHFATSLNFRLDLASALCVGWAGFAFGYSTSFFAGLTLTAAQFGLYALMASLWMAAITRLASRENAATGLALLNALLLVAGTIAPTLVGAMADLLGSMGVAFVALALACAAMIGLARGVRPKQSE